MVDVAGRSSRSRMGVWLVCHGVLSPGGVGALGGARVPLVQGWGCPGLPCEPSHVLAHPQPRHGGSCGIQLFSPETLPSQSHSLHGLCNLSETSQSSKKPEWSHWIVAISQYQK